MHCAAGGGLKVACGQQVRRRGGWDIEHVVVMTGSGSPD